MTNGLERKKKMHSVLNFLCFANFNKVAKTGEVILIYESKRKGMEEKPRKKEKRVNDYYFSITGNFFQGFQGFFFFFF